MTVLSTLAGLRTAFYRLTNTASDDEGMVEFEGSANETVDYFLQHGLWAAQEYIIDFGNKYRWLKASAALAFASGSDATTGGRYEALPADFLRLAGEDDFSALRTPDGKKWGRLIPVEHRYDVFGNCYYIRDDNIWICAGASPPSDVVMDYHWRLQLIASLTFTDFPREYRPLIVAEAAVLAMEEDWFSGTDEDKAALDRNAKAWRTKASRGMRRTQQPRKIKAKPVQGSHWFL